MQARWATWAAMAEQIINSTMSQLKAASARLDADCASTLCLSDLKSARIILQPVFRLGDSLFEGRESMELDEAMVYLRETRICELLLSLLRRWPWAACSKLCGPGLALLPEVLSCVQAFLGVASCVRSSQQAAAIAEMSDRCLS